MTRPALAASLVLALLLPLAVAAAPDFDALGLTPYEPRKPAPAFTLPDLEGRPVSLESFRGKVVLLFYWATW